MLGGHYTKCHPGLSNDYKHMKEVRSKRAMERRALTQAKEEFRRIKGKEVLATPYKLRKMKNDILKRWKDKEL